MPARWLMGIVTVVLFWAAPALADSITFYFEGTVTEVLASGFLDESVTPGTRFTGSYTFDSATPNTSPTPNKGQYRHTSLPNRMRVEVGNYSFQTDPTHPFFTITIQNDFKRLGNDSYTANSWPNSSVGEPLDPFINSIGMRWELWAGTGGPLASIEILTMPSPLQGWAKNDFRIAGSNLICVGACPTLTIRGEVTRIVPEPVHLGLLGLLGVLGLRGFIGS